MADWQSGRILCGSIRRREGCNLNLKGLTALARSLTHSCSKRVREFGFLSFSPVSMPSSLVVVVVVVVAPWKFSECKWVKVVPTLEPFSVNLFVCVCGGYCGMCLPLAVMAAARAQANAIRIIYYYLFTNFLSPAIRSWVAAVFCLLPFSDHFLSFSFLPLPSPSLLNLHQFSFCRTM